MNRLVTSVLSVSALALNTAAFANESVLKNSADPKQWVMQAGNYDNNRYSKLDQINEGNVGKLAPAWSFSTGVLRGHEGSPLVVGDVMYVHTPFPNIVYALDLNNEGKILWKYEPKQDPNVVPVMCCDTVNRGLAYADGKIFLHQADTTVVALNAQTGKVEWSVANGDPKKGETNTATVLPVKDKLLVGISGGEFGVQCHVTAYDIKSGKKIWRAYSGRPGRPDHGRSGKDHRARQAGRQGFVAENLAGRPVEDRRRLHLGLVFLRSRAEPRLLRLGQPLDLEPETASRRQQVVDDPFRPRSRHRHGQMGLSDDPA